MNKLLIAHRGNINGIDKNRENAPDYILQAIYNGFDAEIDVWVINNEIMLGHDNPIYKIDLPFLYNEHLWCHAKNFDALKMMLNVGIHCFWHQNDNFTITSKGFIWTYPGVLAYSNKSVIMTWDENQDKNIDCYAICSDFVEKLK